MFAKPTAVRFSATDVTRHRVSLVGRYMSAISHVPSADGDTPPTPPPSSVKLVASITEELRVLIVAGIAYGVVVAGIGSRLAMFVLRVTSPDAVNGIQSDDDFTIGRFTLTGTYNLLLIGAAVGLIGAGVYRLVRQRLVGPVWFRRLTTGLASGVVVGSMLVHADGIDFRLLKPTWLAVGLFIALPAVFGVFIGPVVDRVGRPDSSTRRGRALWILPIVCVAAFPFTLLLVPFVAVGIAVLHVIANIEAVGRLRESVPFGLVVRGLWLAIAGLGLYVLIGDVIDISRVV